MAEQPPWRQGFDAVERQLSPRLESLVRSESFAVAVGLAARVQRAVEGQLTRQTRRMLHRVNLPAGTDVSRILNELGQLRMQVRELSAELDEARGELASRNGDGSGGDGSPRPPSARQASPRQASPRKASPRSASPRKASARKASPERTPPRKRPAKKAGAA